MKSDFPIRYCPACAEELSDEFMAVKRCPTHGTLTVRAMQVVL